MDFYIQCLDPEKARNRNKFIHVEIFKILEQHRIVCDSLSYKVEPLPASGIEAALNTIDFTSDGNYYYDGKSLSLNQTIELIREKCFQVHVTVDDIYAMKK